MGRTVKHIDDKHEDKHGQRWSGPTEAQEEANERSTGDTHEPKPYTGKLDWPPMASETEEW